MHFLNNKKYLLILAAALMQLVAQAQTIKEDPQLVKGKLDNGLTYYIRHSEKPKGCADFYIAHAVGALQENDNQNGLAHFLEHMAFNGTKHYPEKGVLEFLAKEGVRFGYNINAFTARKQTVYNISSVPLVRDSFVDSVLLVLHDWSGDISCTQQAIDDERGVISEEWRRRDNLKQRIFEQQAALMYNGSLHSKRSVIGTLEIINGFKREELLDFYHKWYRPDMQAIIVVGDFDVKEMEKKIKAQFSDIVLVENPAQKEEVTLPAINGPKVVNIIDPEIQYYAFKVFYREPYPGKDARKDEAYYRDQYARQIVTSVLSDRMAEDYKNSKAPGKRSVVVTNSNGTDYYASQFTFVTEDSTDFRAVARYYAQTMHRLLQYGISKDEFEAAKLNVYKKNKLNENIKEEDLKTSDYVAAYVNNFTLGFPAASPAEVRLAQRRALEGVTYEMAAKYIDEMFNNPQRVYCWSCEEKVASCIPSDKETVEIIDAAFAEPVEPAFLQIKKVTLDVNPAAKAVSKVKAVPAYDGEDWTLPNGALVHWRPAKEKLYGDNHFAMSIQFKTGYPAYPKDNFLAAKFAGAYIKQRAGFRGQDQNGLKNIPELTGIRIMLNASRRYATMSYVSSAEKAENAFKAAYIQLTEPYFSDEKQLKKDKDAFLTNLGLRKKNAEIFNKEDEQMRYSKKDIWRKNIDSAAVNAVDMNFVKDIFQRSFCDFGAMEVFICSDLDKATVKAYVEKYLASLEGGKPVKKEKYISSVPAYKGHALLDRTYKAPNAPKSFVGFDWKITAKPSKKLDATYAVLDYIMSARYLAKIREEKGGTYTISFKSKSYGDDLRIRESTVSFETRPEIKAELAQYTEQIFNEMVQNGPTEAEMSDAVKYLVKHEAESREKVSHNVGMMLHQTISYIRYNEDFQYDYEAVINTVTAQDVQKLAAKIAAGDRFENLFSEE